MHLMPQGFPGVRLRLLLLPTVPPTHLPPLSYPNFSILALRPPGAFSEPVPFTQILGSGLLLGKGRLS